MLLDPGLQQSMVYTAAADVEAVAAQVRHLGYDVTSRDFVEHGNGIFMEYEDEDFFLKVS